LSLTQKDIDRPLGQTPRKRDPGRRNPLGGKLLPAVVVLAVAGTAGAIALRDTPFRTPAPVVTTTPEIAAAPAPPPAPAAKPAAPADGPKIIRVEPGDRPAPTGVVVVGDPSTLGQDLRVAHLPDRDLIEDSPDGPLPIRGADGRRPMDVYARPWSGARGARVALVLGGFAISQTGTQAAIEKLPAEVTIAFSPQGNSIGRWMQAARQKGHELVMQVPLEPFDYPNVNPGRDTLTLDAGPDENGDRLHVALSRITNYAGVMNYMGARFTADPAAMAPLMSELGERGLMYLDDGSSARSLAPELAPKSGVPLALGDGVIDDVRERGSILKKLDELERIARAKGFALGTASAFDVTVDTVAGWVQEARKRGIEIVPVSAVATDPERR
jgi:polysaccharide deacetylase 2 family uncharacterized protein YibQ